MALSTLARVAGDTAELPLTTRLTVAMETRASAATSSIVGTLETRLIIPLKSYGRL